jgi:hypothetical protein
VAALSALVFGTLLAACSSAPTNHGKVEGEAFQAGELVQSDSNRMATLAMKENLDSLMRIMDKLYRRNPGEWKKTASSREAAVAYVRIAIMERQPWQELQGERDVAALSRGEMFELIQRKVGRKKPENGVESRDYG